MRIVIANDHCLHEIISNLESRFQPAITSDLVRDLPPASREVDFPIILRGDFRRWPKTKRIQKPPRVFWLGPRTKKNYNRHAALR